MWDPRRPRKKSRVLLQVLWTLVSQKLPPPASPPRGELAVSLFTITCPPSSLCHVLLMLCCVLFFNQSKLPWAHPCGNATRQASSRARKTNICEQVFSLRAVKYPLGFQDASWLGSDKQAVELKAHRAARTSAVSA